MRKFLVSLFIFLLILVTVGHGYSQTYEAEENVLAVQEKVFHKYHELSFLTGYIADDDFYNVYPIGLAYTFNFSDHYSWEVGRLYLSVNTDNDMKKQLENEFGAAPEQFFEPKAQILSHFVFRPFYGKDAVMNKHIINHETSFFVGGGLDMYKKKTYGKSSDEFDMMFSCGAALKYFINQNFCVAFELHDTVTTREDEFENRLSFGLSFGFRFNLDARKTYSDETLKLLKKYLEE
jgi:outer membrane beta-barrel protein